MAAMDKLTRVACLYRVSTKKQVEENDIPMQKNACKEFISQMPGWVPAKEYSDAADIIGLNWRNPVHSEMLNRFGFIYITETSIYRIIWGLFCIGQNSLTID